MDFRDITEFFKDFMGLIIAFVVIVIIFTFVVAFHPVAGNSMTPTLAEGDIVLVSKFSQKIFDLKRNEIVIIKSKNEKTYIKRVIGLPGEKVDYLNGVLYINDKGYKESFLGEDVVTNNFLFEDICSKEDCPDGVIPEDMYLVLGDNRLDSFDSRDPELGLVPLSNVKGTVLMRIWPVNKIGLVD